MGEARFRPLGNQGADAPGHYNPAQADAIRRGTRGQDVFLVWGPPGTGKTTVIGEWVRYFTQQGRRMLVSSGGAALSLFHHPLTPAEHLCHASRLLSLYPYFHSLPGNTLPRPGATGCRKLVARDPRGVPGA
ncbi:MAG: AAA domain-containing protein [Firmicutes bacterium]|nr:AAA domain-containing protein [Bacillota bacterium]